MNTNISKPPTYKKPLFIMLFLLIFALATYLRLDFLTSVNHHITHDTLNYDIMVRQLLEKGIYAYKDTQPNAQVTPGYPLFMAAVYKMVDYQHHDPFPYIRYIQAGLSLVTLWLMYTIARRLAGTKVAIIVLLISSVYPPFVWSNGAVLTETLACFFLVLYIRLQLTAFEKNTWTFALLSGSVMGLLVLTRPEFLILIVPVYIFHFLWKKELRLTLKLLMFTCIGTGVILSPWVIRNLVSLHQVVIASTQVNPFAAGTYPNNNYEDGMVDRHGKTQMEVAKERLRIGFTQQTWVFIKWYTVGKLKYIYTHMYFGSGHKPLYRVLPGPLGNQLQLALIYFCPIALIASFRRWKQPLTLLTLIVAVMTVTRLAFVPEYRYNYTAMPLIITMDVVTVVAIFRWLWIKLTTSSSHSQKGGVSHAEPNGNP
ncbi:glycosyltransferase family 39 protein [Paenibacillus sp.]|jgi:4-amino-4-deoxy-L-arabinose transferase-like glycosyltransferase|uniref:ArnT family glycosyltransferase n=1 Tax=Paenibacillus sp. TaxID=58172 RepID=UPI0028185EDA|nr:glycosyltransferase family 39 protein [Paenibacillus sp.]MDR0267661.1 glycosyltransferase family 39 protein [Paenibacillus sp.]